MFCAVISGCGDKSAYSDRYVDADGNELVTEDILELTDNFDALLLEVLAPTFSYLAEYPARGEKSDVELIIKYFKENDFSKKIEAMEVIRGKMLGIKQLKRGSNVLAVGIEDMGGKIERLRTHIELAVEWDDTKAIEPDLSNSFTSYVRFEKSIFELKTLYALSDQAVEPMVIS